VNRLTAVAARLAAISTHDHSNTDEDMAVTTDATTKRGGHNHATKGMHKGLTRAQRLRASPLSASVPTSFPARLRLCNTISPPLPKLPFPQGLRL